MDWMTLYTKPNMERYVEQILQSRGIVTYLPLVYEFSKHRQREEPSPFFPCYIFAQVDPLSSSFQLLQWVPGLRQIVSFGDQIAWAPDELIAQVQECVANWTNKNGGQRKMCDFSQGERVRLKTGSLEGI
jgi:transcription antitermination factor NusG